MTSFYQFSSDTKVCIVVFTWVFEDFGKMESMPTTHIWKSETEVSCLYKFSDCNKLYQLSGYFLWSKVHKYTCMFHFLPKFVC